jgi:hypothetical protein
MPWVQTHDNFIPWWKLRMLVIGKPDQMITDLRRSKQSRKLTVCQRRFWSVVITIMFQILCFQTVCVSAWPRYNNVIASLLPKPTLLDESTITCRLVMPLLNAAFRQSVPSQILFSITSGFVASY